MTTLRRIYRQHHTNEWGHRCFSEFYDYGETVLVSLLVNDMGSDGMYEDKGTRTVSKADARALWKANRAARKAENFAKRQGKA